MSIWHTENITCEQCGRSNDVTLADYVGADRSPLARERILDGTLHTLSCHCGHVQRVETAFAYMHLSKGIFYAVLPLSQTTRTIDNRRMISEALTSTVSECEQAEWQVVFGFDHLREKLQDVYANPQQRSVRDAHPAYVNPGCPDDPDYMKITAKYRGDQETGEPLRKIYDILENVPREHTLSNKYLDKILLDRKGSYSAWYTYRNRSGNDGDGTIGLGDKSLKDEDNHLERNLWHEIGHSVQKKIDKTSRPSRKATRWLIEDVGWREFRLSRNNIKAWADQMNDWQNLDDDAQRLVTQAILLYLQSPSERLQQRQPGPEEIDAVIGEWLSMRSPADVRYVYENQDMLKRLINYCWDEEPEDRAEYESYFKCGPLRACRGSKSEWWKQPDKWYSTGKQDEDRRFFVNHFYKTLISVKQKVVRFVENELHDRRFSDRRYALMSRDEFFAELFVAHYLSDTGLGDYEAWFTQNVGKKPEAPRTLPPGEKV